jgi:hypothetical protein
MRDYAGEIPVFLEADLFEAGWDGSLNPYPGETVRQVAMRSLRKSIVKKFSDGTDVEANKRALELFLSVNSSCSQYISTVSQQLTELQAIAFGEAKDFIYNFFYRDGVSCVLNTASISEFIGWGNGAAVGSSGTDFLSKVGTSTMAATNPALHQFFKQAIADDPVWSSVESTRSERLGYALVRGSRLSFVPKTTEISRTICTEPLCNMFLQKGVGIAIERQLRKVCGIDLTNQQFKNRTMARLGSKTDIFGTIDLSSASDSMSIGLVREFFPRQVVSWLELTRSPVTILPDGTEVELHMVSSMGNAFTFPLQTLYFLSLVYGAYRALGFMPRFPFGHSFGNLAVNGDDIIVIRRAYALVCQLLSLTGFKVNVDKSFNEGFFRESCGGDYYLGENVRGVYIKRLKDDADRYSAINRLNCWSAAHGILLNHTVSFLRKGLRTLYVPFDEMDTAGLKVPSSMITPRKSKATGGLLYRYLHLVPTEVSISSLEARPEKLKGWFPNHDAILLAALAGTLRTGKVVTRSSRRSTRIRQRSSSRWDWIPADQRLCAGFGGRWKSAVELNFTSF